MKKLDRSNAVLRGCFYIPVFQVLVHVGHFAFLATMVRIVATPVISPVSSMISTSHLTIPLGISASSPGWVGLGSWLIFSLQVKRICIVAPGYTGLVNLNSSIP